MSTFKLKIIACNRVFFDGDCRLLVFPGYDGEVGVMAHHESMTAIVSVGEIRYQLADGTVQYAVVSEGFLKFEDNEATVIVFSAERPDEIDQARAQAAFERAKEQLQQKQSAVEYRLSTMSMAKAMARMRAHDKYVN
ncbi:MAG: ATP synthase F1 subunit epsilon [Wujia sp.]